MSSPLPTTRATGRPLVVDPAQLRQAVLRNLDAHTTQRGQIEMPCAPAALDHYMSRLCGQFQTMGRSLAPQEADDLRCLVAENLRRGFDLAPTAKLVVQYEIQSSLRGPFRSGLAFSRLRRITQHAHQARRITRARWPVVIQYLSGSRAVRAGAVVARDVAGRLGVAFHHARNDGSAGRFATDGHLERVGGRVRTCAPATRRVATDWLVHVLDHRQGDYANRKRLSAG